MFGPGNADAGGAKAADGVLTGFILSRRGGGCMAAQTELELVKAGRISPEPATNHANHVMSAHQGCRKAEYCPVETRSSWT